MSDPTVKIQKNIPLPSRRKRRNRWSENITKWEIGDSVLFDDFVDLMSFRNAATRLGQKVTTAREPQKNGSTKFRAWRLE